jgi:hypothetical protein
MEYSKKTDAVAYLRVSSTKQFQQGESIEDQRRICINVAKLNNLGIIPADKPFYDVYSGRKEKRPGYEDLKRFAKKHPSVKYCIIRGIDRFTRSGAFVYELMKKELGSLNIQLIDGNGIIQPEKNTLEHLGVEYSWSRYSPSKASELMEAHRGEREVTDILTRTIGAEIVLTREGYHVGPPRDGYLNDTMIVNGKKKPIEKADKDRAHFFTKMYELRASGSFSDQEIVDQINAMGFRSKKRNKWSKDKKDIIGTTGGLPLTVKRLQKIISSPIYCGISNGRWVPEPIKTKYPGLVSIPLFNRANKGKVFIEEHRGGKIKIHKDYNPHAKRRTQDNPLFPYKSVIMCPLCEKPFLGSSSRGKSGKKFPFYHCSRNHKYYGVSKKEFEETLANFIVNLKYKEGFLKSFKATLINKYREKEKELGQFSLESSKTINDLETKKLQKIEAFTATKSEIIRDELEKQIEELQNQISSAQEERNKLEIEEKDIHKFIKYVKYLMEHPKEMLLKQRNSAILRALFGLVFDELPTYTEIANGTPKLSLVYKLSEEFETGKSLIAGYKVFRWNTVVKNVVKWNCTFGKFDIAA